MQLKQASHDGTFPHARECLKKAILTTSGRNAIFYLSQYFTSSDKILGLIFNKIAKIDQWLVCCTDWNGDSGDVLFKLFVRPQ